MPWGQSFNPVWTGSGLDKVFAFRGEQTTVTCTIDMIHSRGASGHMVFSPGDLGDV